MRRRYVGFTLIEMLVTVAVVSVLLGLALPALRNARVTADSTACLVSLSSIAKMQAAYAAGNDGRWPNDFEPNKPGPNYAFNNTNLVLNDPSGQTFAWPGPLWKRGYYDSDEPPQGVSCPVVYREWHDTRSETEQRVEMSPMLSYHYSFAMFTQSSLWDPTDAVAESARVNPLLFGHLPYAKSVRTDEVKFPSHKVVMSEKEDNHGRGVLFGDPGLLDSERAMAKANVSFADGHVDRVEPYRAQEPLAIHWSYDWLPNGVGAIPFSAAAWGYRGRDY